MNISALYTTIRVLLRENKLPAKKLHKAVANDIALSVREQVLRAANPRAPVTVHYGLCGVEFRIIAKMNGAGAFTAEYKGDE